MGFRPPEFIALPPAQRKRVWNRCYWRALRRPRLIIPLIALGTAVALLIAVSQYLTGPMSSAWGSVARFGMIIIGQMALTFVFAKYAVYVLRDELRLCATGCCLNCWYDLTGNISGVCPECGTLRTSGPSDNSGGRGLLKRSARSGRRHAMMRFRPKRWLRGLRTRWCNVRLAAVDARYGRGCAPSDRRMLVLRQKTHLVDYNDHFLAWVARTSPREAGAFLLRRVPSRRPIDWDRVGLVVPWVQDPVKEHHPAVYEALKAIESICDARGIPVVNRVDALSNSIKSVTAARLAAAGIRVPRMVPITDAAAFRARAAEQLGFPLIIREDRGHGTRIALVASSAQLALVPLESYQCPIAVEFIDTRGPDGVYRKYRYVAMGDGGAPRHLLVSREWEVRVRARLMTPAIAAEEVAYLRDPIRDREMFRIAREALGLDVVAFDYSFGRDGQLIIWEANPAAILWDNKSTHAGLEHQRPYIDRLYAELLAYLNRRLAAAPAVAGDVSVTVKAPSPHYPAVLSASDDRAG